MTPFRAWLALFALWFVFLSGAVAGIVGPPGVIQSIRLRGVLDLKQDQVQQLRGEISRLEEESSQLEHSRFIQQREIRRVLGYAAPDEIIFDFTPTDRIETP